MSSTTPRLISPTRSVLLIAALVAALGLSPATAPGASADDSPPFLVGTGAASTEPLGQICVGGYGTFCTRPSQGSRDPLMARGLAISSAAAPDDGVVVVTSTAVGLFSAYKATLGGDGLDAARTRIAGRTGLDPHRVIIVSDHSHAGPDTIGIWGGVDEAYMSILIDGIVDAGVSAVASRQPADMSWAVVDAAAHGYTLESSYRQGPTDDAAMDNEFRVLFADDREGQRIATFVNYAPHATVCGKCDDQLSGDWTAWVADEVRSRTGGMGLGAVGTLGATDWNKPGATPDAREAEARQRINDLLDVAEETRVAVQGDEVAGSGVFVIEQIGQPVLLANYLPGIEDPLFGQTEGRLSIDRSLRPPYLQGDTMGTWAGAFRVGDVMITTFPGEPFPQLGDLMREGVDGPSAQFILGAAQDFLGYMVADEVTYQQTVEEGLTYLAGCPEEEVFGHVGHSHDGACPDHWTLQVSPTIGIHLVCTAQDVAADMGFTVTVRDGRCPALTALDGMADPLTSPSPPVAD